MTGPTAVSDDEPDKTAGASGHVSENGDVRAGDSIVLTITHHGSTHTFTLPADGDLSTLNAAVTAELGIAASQQKLMVTPKVGLLRPPYKKSENNQLLPLSALVGKKIQLLAPLPNELESLNAASSSFAAAAARRREGPLIKPAKPARTIDHARAHADVTYTFGRIEPLAYLPNPERSRRFLERLASDPGIRAAMRSHQFRVGLLTEMNPAEHTTHESRTLGLNRNKGAVIELRLRTDAYDGYRDYRTIRDTLCHELAHNVWSEHDRNFWDLTHQIEKEVARADWTRGGRTVGNEEFYNPEDHQRHTSGSGSDSHVDAGGWTGGEFVLGSGSSPTETNSPSTAAQSSSSTSSGLGMRELMARAAEQRLASQNQTGTLAEQQQYQQQEADPTADSESARERQQQRQENREKAYALARWASNRAKRLNDEMRRNAEMKAEHEGKDKGKADGEGRN